MRNAVLCILLGVTSPASLVLADDIKGGYPSQLQDAPVGSVGTIKSLVQPIGDFRSLFCSPSTINDRVARSVCIVDAKNKGGTVTEFKLDSPMTLGEVLMKSGHEKWKGAPAIKLFQKLSILQTPTTTVTPANQKLIAEILQTPIMPGDLIFFEMTL